MGGPAAAAGQVTAAAGTLAVRLKHCGKTFANGTVALSPLDLTIKAGETLAFLGPSGCGKTTLLRLIAGLDMPDPPGRVWFGADDVTHRPIERRQVGMVFQNYALFPNMDVAGNVAYGLRVRGLAKPERAERVAELLAMMRIRDLADRRIDQLSGGQRQRVALARALAPEPRILLFDEPLTALDAKLRDTLRVEIAALLRQLGITAVYVTHDQSEAMALGDRVAVMSHGRIAQIGTPREIYDSPANRFVADFVGVMNRVPGLCRDGWLDCRGGRIPLADASATGPAEALFRPERVRLAAGPGAHLQGVVAASFFFGDRTRILLDGVGDSTLTIDCSEPVDLARGDPIYFDVPSATILPAGQDE